MRRCLVLGSASCLWLDVDAALSVGEYDAVIAVKRTGIVWPGPLYSWVSLHPDWMVDYAAQRAERGHPPAREIVAHEMRPGIDRVANHKWPEQTTRSGASGMFGVKVAIEDGFDRIVICGMPMSQQIGRIDGRRTWHSARTYQPAVLQAVHHMKDKVRSVSGWTMELLGYPSAEWLNGELELPADECERALRRGERLNTSMGEGPEGLS
jgi:hypothetical protein